MDVSRAERMRLYHKQRYENSPDKHEKDKERYRKYMSSLRQDPDFRRMENEKRKERRRLKRESLKASSSVTRSATRTRAAPQKRVKKEPVVYLTDDSTPMGDMDILMPEPEDDHDVDQDDEDEHVEEIGQNEKVVLIYDQDIPVAPEESITEAAEKAMDNFTVTIPQAEMLDKSIQVDDFTPECPCSESMVLMELAAASRELSVYQRKSFESGLIQYLEDFRSSSAQDTFTLLICDKLKRVSDDLRPDLEVSILKAINDTLKADKCKKVSHKK